VVVTPTLGQLEDRRQPTTTLEGWRRFVDAEEATFELLQDAEWTALEDAGRLDYEEARIAHHAEMIVVTTSTIEQILHQGRLLTLLNQREIGARRSLIVSGPAATGKTTAVKQLGRTHELHIRKRYPDCDRIPVVYVTAPPKGSPRKLAAELARFLGLPPVRGRQNVTDITDAVCQVLLDAQNDLVIVDEIHNLNLATSAGEDLSDHLKYFTEHLPATFVYAGIDVERAGLFTGTRGRQIAGRAALIRTGPFPYQQAWKGLVATMEDTLRLHRHQPGSLLRLDRYLHQRTGGMIGSLSHLIRAAAISAILDDSEQITQELLDTIMVDHAAESSARRASSHAG
jgi:AAA domain